MLLKESTRIFTSSTSSVAWAIYSPASSITSSCTGNSMHSCRPHLRRRQRREYLSILDWNCSSSRCYASVSDHILSRPSASAATHTWPTSVNPTPYEILAHSKESKYNKALFYELVKIYHPDRDHTVIDSSISSSVRLERYRLVVSANEILSNPAKRRAYDLYGAGWNGKGAMESLHREADRSWRNEPGNASANATWEDWERWRQARDGTGQPQTPVFVSNEVFVFLLGFCVLVGTFAEVHRADRHSMNLAEVQDRKHAAITNDMTRRQNEQANLNRQERIERFVRERNSWIAVSTNNKAEPSTEDQ